MSAFERNKAWVYEAARDTAKSKRSISHGQVTVGEVVKGLGFSSATVRKYFDVLCSEGHMHLIVDTSSVKIYYVVDLS